MKSPRLTSRSLAELENELRTTTRFTSLLWIPTCGSTQDLAASDQLPGQPCVWTDDQTDGRGRRGRVWSSTVGEDVETTLRWTAERRPGAPIRMAAALPAVLADAIELEAARQGRPLPETIRIKWPNDLYVELDASGPRRPHKLSGLLIDATTMTDQLRLVVGIGINVNRRAFPPDLDQPATSLSLMTDAVFDRGDMLLAVARAVDTAIGTLQDPPPGLLAEVGQRFSSRLLGQNPVRARLTRHGEGEQQVEARAADLDGIITDAGRVAWTDVETFVVGPS